MKFKIAPSILSANFAKLGQEIKDITVAGADYVHIDVMDGNFVEPITIGSDVIRALRPYSNLPFDVHLMIGNPERQIDIFADAGADIITIHLESTIHIDRQLTRIKALGKKAGVSLIPSTHEDTLDYILDKLDLILVMSVNPGYGGQSFLPAQLRKISNIKQKIKNSSIELSVDGGVNLSNIGQIVDAGANVVVAGSAVFHNGEYRNNIDKLRAKV